MSFIRNFFENLILVTAFQLGLTMSSMAQGMKQTQTLTHINYKTSNPSTTLIDSSFFAKIVALLDSESCSKSAKDSCVFYMWKAFSDPVNFDTAFEDAATSTLRMQANGKLHNERRPYLTEWTNSRNEYDYLRIVLHIFLSHYRFQGYADDPQGVQTAFNLMCQTYNINIPDFKRSEPTIEYLKRIEGTSLKPIRKVALYSDTGSIYVCRLEDQNRLIDLLYSARIKLISEK